MNHVYLLKVENRNDKKYERSDKTIQSEVVSVSTNLPSDYNELVNVFWNEAKYLIGYQLFCDICYRMVEEIKNSCIERTVIVSDWVESEIYREHFIRFKIIKKDVISFNKHKNTCFNSSDMIV